MRAPRFQRGKLGPCPAFGGDYATSPQNSILLPFLENEIHAKRD